MSRMPIAQWKLGTARVTTLLLYVPTGANSFACNYESFMRPSERMAFLARRPRHPLLSLPPADITGSQRRSPFLSFLADCCLQPRSPLFFGFYFPPQFHRNGHDSRMVPDSFGNRARVELLSNRGCGAARAVVNGTWKTCIIKRRVDISLPHRFHCTTLSSSELGSSHRAPTGY